MFRKFVVWRSFLFASLLCLFSFSSSAQEMQQQIRLGSKKYTVTTVGCTANVSKAKAGKKVKVVAVVPDSWDDCKVTWSADVDGVKFKKDGLKASFKMPANDVTVTAVVKRRTYSITTENCTANVKKARKGKRVTVEATFPVGVNYQDYEVKWSASVKSIQFKKDGIRATFKMPGEKVTITAKLKKKSFPITTDGCTASASKAKPGKKITATAILPLEALENEFDVNWDVQLTFSGEESEEFKKSVYESMNIQKKGIKLSFLMPRYPVLVKAQVVVVPPTTYAITTHGCIANVTRAKKGDLVTVRADLPFGWDPYHYDFTWEWDLVGVTVPYSQFQALLDQMQEQYTVNDSVFSFYMPGAPIDIECEWEYNPYK